MSRIEALLQRTATPVTTDTITGLTLSGTNRLVYVFAALQSTVTRVVDTITIGGTTVYELGVTDDPLIATVDDAGNNQRLQVFRVFDTALPVNGERDVVTTLDAELSGRMIHAAVSYDDADQTTGHRGTPATYGTEDANLSLAITVDSADQEGIALVAWSGSITITADAPTTVLVKEDTGSTGIRGALLQRPAGGQPVAATLSADSVRDTGWGASILATAAVAAATLRTVHSNLRW
jgi:hypothetical protein